MLRALPNKGSVLSLFRLRLVDIGFAVATLGLALQSNVARFYENKVPPGGPLALVEGTYAVPFQYRVLIPLALRGLLKVPTGLSFMWMYAAFDLVAVLGLCFVMRDLILRFTGNPLYASISTLGLFESQFWANLEALTDWPRLAAYLMNFGGIWIPVAIWQHKLAEPFLRRALLVCVVQMLVLGTVGMLDEMRVYGEMIPVIYLALVMLVWQVGGVAKLARIWQLKLSGLGGHTQRSGVLQIKLQHPLVATL